MTLQTILGYINPFKGNYPITLGYGDPLPPKFGGGKSGAIDFGVPEGTPIFAAQAGQVKSADWNVGGGNVMEIMHANGISTVYGHLQAFVRRPGDIVARGDLIGYSGNTGAYTTGPHLLFGARQNGENINPLTLFDPTIPASGSDYHATKGAVRPGKDGNCPAGYFAGVQAGTGWCYPNENLGNVPFVGGALQAAKTTTDVIGKLFDPMFWAHVLALLAGVILIFFGWNKMWEAA